MNFKISTKEILHIISLNEGELAANMTGELNKILIKYCSEPVANVVLNLGNIEKVDVQVAKEILGIQQEFYDKHHSLVVCCLQKEVEIFFEEQDILEHLNVTPTEMEACDIVQMEEIERELLS